MKVLLYIFVFYSFSLEAVDHEGMQRRSREQPIHSPRHAIQYEYENFYDNNPRNRPVPFKILHYALDIVADPDMRIVRGISAMSLQSRAQNLETITVDAYDMEISSVRVNSVETPFRYDGEMIQVLLKKPLAYNEPVEVSIAYTAKRSQNFYLVGPNIINPARMKTAYTFTQPEDSRKWFPCIDRPSAKAPFEIKVAVPKAYKVLSNGNLISKIPKNNFVEFHYKVEQPIAPYLVSLAIGNYDVLSIGEFRSKPLSLWTPPLLKDAAIRDTARTSKMMEVFGRFTGVEYPFPAYVQSIAPAWEVSMEHQAASTLGSWVITGDGMDEATVAHELAHQWFGNWVTPETWGDLWLSEGFATYLPYVFFMEMDSDNKGLGEIDDWRQSYFNEAKKISHALSPLEPNVDTMFDAHAYEKGALVIKLMRFIANLTPSDGEEPFKKAVRLYLNEHAEKTVRHTDLQRSLETVTGTSWQIFFDQWVRSPGHPRLDVEFEDQGDELVLSVTQSQWEDENLDWPTFQFPIPVDFYVEDGSRVRRIVQIYDSSQEIRIRLGMKVVAVDFDPDWDAPVEVEIDQDAKAWMKILDYTPSEMSQIRAMRVILSKNLIPQEELIQRLLKHSSLYLKTDAMDKLSKKTENRQWIERILAHLHTRKEEWDHIIRNAVAAAQAWLLKTNPGKISSEEEQRLQSEFINANLTVSERKSILDELSAISLANTQKFAIARLQEGRWFMRDRGNLLDVLSKQPTEASHSFLKELLKESNYYWFRKITMNLIAAKYDKVDLVPILVNRANTDPQLVGRSRAIELLAVQTTSKKKVCAVLLTLSKVHEEKPDRLQDVRTTAMKALDVQGCLENNVP